MSKFNYGAQSHPLLEHCIWWPWPGTLPNTPLLGEANSELKLRKPFVSPLSWTIAGNVCTRRQETIQYLQFFDPSSVTVRIFSGRLRLSQNTKAFLDHSVDHTTRPLSLRGWRSTTITRWDGGNKNQRWRSQKKQLKNEWFLSPFLLLSFSFFHPSIHPSFHPSLTFSPKSPWCTSSKAGSRDTPWVTGWSRRRCSRPAGSSLVQSRARRLAGSALERVTLAWPGAAGAGGAYQTSDPRWRWDRGLSGAEPKQAGRESCSKYWWEVV